MASRRLSDSESKKANRLLESIRARLQALGAGDPELLFAFRRRIHIRLMHDERGTPAHRKKLKKKKWDEQDGVCAICRKNLPLAESELDRFKASAGYTAANTQLVHHTCHRKQQEKRRYR